MTGIQKRIAVDADVVDPVAARAMGGRPRISAGTVSRDSQLSAQLTTGPASLVNAMTVDVEDYFQVAALSERVHRDEWDSYPSRVERNTEALLSLFAEFRVRATLFTLGWVAERFPQLIRRITEAGHELASHGWSHVRVDAQSAEEFRADVVRTKRLLEDVSGYAVLGYRAANFSVSEKTPWAFDVLAEAGYAYSSSVYPIRHDHYGMPSAPRFAFRPAGGAFVEVPVSSIELGGRTLPCGGGGYFRLLPYRLSRWALQRVHEHDGQPCIFYFHPWEIDPGQPRVGGLSWRSRFRHYSNLGIMEAKLRRLLTDFHWDRMDRVFLDHHGAPA